MSILRILGKSIRLGGSAQRGLEPWHRYAEVEGVRYGCQSAETGLCRIHAARVLRPSPVRADAMKSADGRRYPWGLLFAEPRVSSVVACTAASWDALGGRARAASRSRPSARSRHRFSASGGWHTRGQLVQLAECLLPRDLGEVSSTKPDALQHVPELACICHRQNARVA